MLLNRALNRILKGIREAFGGALAVGRHGGGRAAQLGDPRPSTSTARGRALCAGAAGPFAAPGGGPELRGLPTAEDEASGAVRRREADSGADSDGCPSIFHLFFIIFSSFL